MYNQWRQNIETQKSNPFAKVCELHFRPDCFVRDLEAELTGRPIRKRLKGTIDKSMLYSYLNFFLLKLTKFHNRLSIWSNIVTLINMFSTKKF